MGIYIFNYKILRDYLIADAKTDSDHDFGKNIIPNMMKDHRKMVAYTYHGYWKDVGTVSSLHQANMDLLKNGANGLDIYSIFGPNKILSEDMHSTPQFIGPKAEVKDSLINQGAQIFGKVNHCVVSDDVVVEEGAVCINDVLMPGAVIRKGAKVENAIIGPNTLIEENAEVNLEHDDIELVVNRKAARL